jgi:hypothetical protein
MKVQRASVCMPMGTHARVSVCASRCGLLWPGHATDRHLQSVRCIDAAEGWRASSPLRHMQQCTTTSVCSSSTSATAVAASRTAVRRTRWRSWSRAERAAFLHRRAAQAGTHATGDRTTSRRVTADGASLDHAVRGEQGCQRGEAWSTALHG